MAGELKGAEPTSGRRRVGRKRLSLVLTVLITATVGALFFRGDALGRVSLIVTVAGLAIALWQIEQNTTATEAASAAVEAALKSIVTHQVLSIVPSLREAESALDAATAGTPEQMGAALVEYRRVAAEARGILRRRQVKDDAIVAQLEDTISLAVVTKGRLTKEGVDPQKLMSVMLRKASSVCDELTSLAAFLVADPTLGEVK